MSLDISARTPRKAHNWARDELDWYVEPESVTDALLGVERFDGPIWDPACGGGNIVKAAHRAGLQARGSDVVDRTYSAPWFLGHIDFLTDDDRVFNAHNIICNPPFFRAAGTEAFIRRALSLARGKVAIFADVKFLASQRRADGLFRDHCPHRVWTLSKRPSCPPGEWIAAGNKPAGGTADWMWMVWDLTAPPVATYQGGWLRTGIEARP